MSSKIFGVFFEKTTVKRHSKKTSFREPYELDDFWPLSRKKGETLIEQTIREQLGNLDFKTNKSGEIFSFEAPLGLEGKLMLGEASLEVGNSCFNKKEDNNIFSIYHFNHWKDPTFLKKELVFFISLKITGSILFAANSKISGNEVKMANRPMCLQPVS